MKYKVYTQDGYTARYRNFSNTYQTHRIASITRPDGTQVTHSYDRQVVGIERCYNHGSEKYCVGVIKAAIEWDRMSEVQKEAWREEIRNHPQELF